MFKLTSLNLNGLRSATAKGLPDWVAQLAPDCICVQEIRVQHGDVEKGRFEQLAGLQGYFHFAEKKGYAGTAIYTRHVPSQVRIGWGDAEFDAEGRYTELRFDTPARKCSIISVYFPSGSSGQERQAAKYRFLDRFFPYLKALARERAFILCGDINIAHQEIDLKNWKGNVKNSGFLPEERAWMSKLLDAGAAGGGLIDIYRTLYPDATEACYTWWSNRGQAYAKNVGWRLDYHLATPALAAAARAAAIDKSRRLSDHAPITVDYDFTL
ncbi:MAG: exodeoxyribonuclease III [Burkholderiaceae bacterium]|nr:exodeoxyribonuclease III [Burkholderiaceae bacterium]